MAKNTESTTYRKIDVDALDDDKYDDGYDGVANGAIDENLVQSLLNTGNNLGALRAAIQNPPFTCKDQAVKDRATTLVGKVLGSFRSNEVEGVVSNLTDKEADIVLKFVYRAFDLLAESALCQLLLVWHAQIVAKFGIGSVMRVINSRSRL